MWVATDQSGATVGMANIGPTRDEDLVADDVADLFAIYVVPDHWSDGHGRDLMVAALSGVAELGFKGAALWVLDSNERGRRFYESGGWTTDGTTKVDDSFGLPIQEVRYRISVDSSDP